MRRPLFRQSIRSLEAEFEGPISIFFASSSMNSNTAPQIAQSC